MTDTLRHTTTHYISLWKHFKHFCYSNNFQMKAPWFVTWRHIFSISNNNYITYLEWVRGTEKNSNSSDVSNKKLLTFQHLNIIRPKTPRTRSYGGRSDQKRTHFAWVFVLFMKRKHLKWSSPFEWTQYSPICSKDSLPNEKSSIF